MAIAQTTQSIRPLREAVQIGVLFALAILLVTQDLHSVTSFALLGLALLIALNGYRRTRSAQAHPWECNDEP